MSLLTSIQVTTSRLTHAELETCLSRVDAAIAGLENYRTDPLYPIYDELIAVFDWLEGEVKRGDQ